MLALGALSGCGQPAATSSAARPALAYKITGDAIAAAEVYSGDVRARVEVDHAFRVGGKITKRAADIGMTVKRGQLLAQIDAQDVTLGSDAARAQVLAFKTEADFAEAELARFKDLFTKGFVSQSALDQKLNLANAAKARLHAQQAQASVSLNQASYALLHAETDGVVTQVFAETGQVISPGQAVLRIANPREKELAIGVSESHISEFRARLNSKTPITVGVWANAEQQYPAKVRELSTAADPVTRTYSARVTITAPDTAVQLGMSGYAVFMGARTSGELAVPLSSIYIRDQTTGVWQIGADGKVSLRAIVVVKYTEGYAIVKPATGALKAGDLIVAAGAHKLREGDVVKPIIDKVITGDGKVAHANSSAGGSPALSQFATASGFRRALQ